MKNREGNEDVSKLLLRNIRKNYGALAVVDDLTLELRKGELVTLLGPSGCGKTTTLRMIAGFIELTAGAIEIDGKEISSVKRTVPPEHRGMSMIFQSYAIWPNMTVAENVGFGLNVRRTPADEVKRAVSSSAWRWRARWSCGPRCFCSTSRCRTSTPTCARRWPTRFGGCTTSSSSRRCTSRTTSRRP
jgi:ABC-type branched-subunit amino acid transport system ATPase component